MVLEYGVEDKENMPEMMKIDKNFRIDRCGGINTIPMEKRVRPIINKGKITNTRKIVPFGWSSQQYCIANNPNNCSCKNNFMDFNFMDFNA